MTHPGPTPERRAKVECLADYLADGMTVREAKDLMGISHPASRAYFKTLCDELGPQSIGTWRMPWPPIIVTEIEQCPQ